MFARAGFLAETEAEPEAKAAPIFMRPLWIHPDVPEQIVQRMRHDNDLGDLEDLDLLLDCAYEHYLSLSSVIGYRVPFHASQMSRMEVAAECDFQERHAAHGYTVDMSNNTCYFSETPITESE